MKWEINFFYFKWGGYFLITLLSNFVQDVLILMGSKKKKK